MIILKCHLSQQSSGDFLGVNQPASPTIEPLREEMWQTKIIIMLNGRGIFSICRAHCDVVAPTAGTEAADQFSSEG